LRLDDLQGVNNSWFCGSYFGYGFHEDGLKSGMYVASKL
jgi:predicted NAD/FAD-binding protein